MLPTSERYVCACQEEVPAVREEPLPPLPVPCTVLGTWLVEQSLGLELWGEEVGRGHFQDVWTRAELRESLDLL